MIEIRKDEVKGSYVYGTKTEKIYFIGTHEECEHYIEQRRERRKKDIINKNRRERNQILRDLCGTSAAAARKDMGL